jgi:hypothetical protein
VAGKIGFILGALDLSAAQAISLVQASRDLLLHGQGWTKTLRISSAHG